MRFTKILLGLIIVLAISFIGFQIFKLEEIAIIVRALILPLLTILYYLEVKDKKSYFFYFLLLTSIQEFMGVFSSFSTDNLLLSDIMYYGGNTLNIIAYFILFLEILKSMNLKDAINRFPIHIIILLVLDIYIVIFVSEIAVNSGDLRAIDYLIEFSYNTSVMLLLTVTLINYISRDSKKAMNLLIGALCIVVSEVIQVGYFYISEISILSVVYSILLVLAFSFFYIQSSMKYIKEKNYESFEKLEV